MNIKVDVNKLSFIEQDTLNAGEYNIHECNFTFSEEYNGLVKKAVFSNEEHSYQVLLVYDKCVIPYEILQKDGNIEIGLYAYEVDDEDLVLRYSPKPMKKYINIGSYREHYDNYEEVTATDKEQMEQALQDGLNDIAEAVENAERLDVDVNKEETTTTITITKQDGTTKNVDVLDGTDGQDGQDGVSLEYNWSGTSLGIKRDDEQNYNYVNLKGDKGEPGEIEFTIVNELPQTGNEGVIYLVPLETPESEENNYAEYIYVNNEWELLGKIGVQIDLSNYYTKQEVNNLIPTQLSELSDDSTHRLTTDTEKTTWNNKYAKPIAGIPKTDLASDVQTSLGKADTALQEHQDLTDYVKNTDYATSSKGGVFKSLWLYGVQVTANGELNSPTMTYQNYTSGNNNMIISKGTLENVLDAKIGDINTAIDAINGEVI